MKDDFKAIQYEDRKCGPGGYKCYCCGPPPKGRPEFRRLARTRLKRKDKKEIEQECNF